MNDYISGQCTSCLTSYCSFSFLFSTDTLWWSAWNAIPAQWPRTCQRPSWRGGQRSSHSSRLPTTTIWCPPVTPWTLTSPSPPSTRMPSRSHQRGRSPGRGHQLRSLFFCQTRLLESKWTHLLSSEENEFLTNWSLVSLRLRYVVDQLLICLNN